MAFMHLPVSISLRTFGPLSKSIHCLTLPSKAVVNRLVSLAQIALINHSCASCVRQNETKKKTKSKQFLGFQMQNDRS